MDITYFNRSPHFFGKPGHEHAAITTRKVQLLDPSNFAEMRKWADRSDFIGWASKAPRTDWTAESTFIVGDMKRSVHTGYGSAERSPERAAAKLRKEVNKTQRELLDLQVNAAKRLEHELAHHDWYYAMSDDGRVYRGGEAHAKLINRLMEEVPSEVADRLWAKYAPKDFRKPRRASMHKVSERSALIRLASALPKGSKERKVILAGLEKSARTIKVIYYTDPSHGWIQVPKDLLDELGIADKISRYSYMKGPWAYLEEDRDASLFARAAKAAGITIRPEEEHAGGQSPVRNYQSYRAASWDKNARSHRLKADMKLRNGDVLPKGTIVEVDFRKGGMSTALLTAEFDGPSGHDYRRKGFQFPIGRLHDFVPGMSKPPSTGKLTRMVYDGIASTVTGKRVEPDGHGPDGSPSWLLVMGLI